MVKIFKIEIFIVLLLTASLLLVGAWYSYTANFDTSTVGLMAVNISRGNDYPLFYYGQPYFGALEAYLAALYVSVFGFSEFITTLSPITFTLFWIFFSYLLFARIGGFRSGIVAALCTGFSGYYIFWYSIATYGGYSVIFCLGTAILWLAVLVFQNNPKGIQLVVVSAALGILSALAIWVHALTFPYLVVAAIILLVHIIRQRLRADVMFCLFLAFCIGLTGFLPFFIKTGSFFGGVSARIPLQWHRMQEAFVFLFRKNIPELFIWNWLASSGSIFSIIIVRYFLVSLLLFAVFMACISVVLHDKRKIVSYLIPIAFLFIFIGLYVQHQMALVQAPRYVIGFWIMLLCVIWTLAIVYWKGRIRYVAWAAFLLFLCIQIAGTIQFILGNHKVKIREQETARSIVDAVRDVGADSVILYGDRIFGYTALKLSMFAEGRIHFANAGFEERYENNAQYTELDNHRVYLTNANSYSSLKNALFRLGVTSKEKSIKGYTLFFDIESGAREVLKPIAYTLVDKDLQPMKNNVLHDGNQDTGLAEIRENSNEWILDTGKIQRIKEIWLFPKMDPFSLDPFPLKNFEVSASDDGEIFQEIYRNSGRIANAYYNGNVPFVGGPRGKSEILLKDTQARYIKIIVHNDNQPFIQETLLFTSKDAPLVISDEEFKKIAEVVRREQIEFVYADRLLSANLLSLQDKTYNRDIALRRHSTSFKNNPMQLFVVPKRQFAFACTIECAEYCQSVVEAEYGEAAIYKRIDFPHYALFIFKNLNDDFLKEKREALIWNGHVIQKTSDLQIIAPWLYRNGAPIWRPDYTESQGFYHDSWSGGKGRLSGLNYHRVKMAEERIVLVTNGWRPFTDVREIQLKILINGKMPAVFLGREKGNRYIFSLPDNVEYVESIDILSTTFVPPGQDNRQLGVDVKYLEIEKTY